MSEPSFDQVVCPECGARWEQRLYRSLNADRVPAQTIAIASATFERVECPDCGLGFQPEHPMLYVDLSRRTWIVMQPRADRELHVELADEVQRRFKRNIRAM